MIPIPPISSQVLIVGAGPTGLTIAHELLRVVLQKGKLISYSEEKRAKETLHHEHSQSESVQMASLPV